MSPTSQGSFRLFRFAGITVFLHWSWFLVAWLAYQRRMGAYSSPVWNLIEYVSLFLIVLMHEFGHSLACRQTGGAADQIVLWPLGGVAYVAPPRRPGAVLWSIAAGPLVNVLLVPVLFALSLATSQMSGDIPRLLDTIWLINLMLLIFNLLPVYPLDGGQIFRALLWFICGESRSLKIAVVVGFIGIAALGAYAIVQRSLWLGILSGFLLSGCINGWRYAQFLRAHESPRE